MLTEQIVAVGFFLICVMLVLWACIREYGNGKGTAKLLGEVIERLDKIEARLANVESLSIEQERLRQLNDQLMLAATGTKEN